MSAQDETSSARAWERLTQVAIMLTIGGAMALELMSIASGLEIWRRKRVKVSVLFPAADEGVSSSTWSPVFCAPMLSLD